MFYQYAPGATLGKKRLNGLVILDLEIKMAKTINYGDVIEILHDKKGGKRILMNKN